MSPTWTSSLLPTALRWPVEILGLEAHHPEHMRKLMHQAKEYVLEWLDIYNPGYLTVTLAFSGDETAVRLLTAVYLRRQDSNVREVS